MKFIEIEPLEKILHNMFPREHIVEDKLAYLLSTGAYTKLFLLPFALSLQIPITKVRLIKTDNYYFIDLRLDALIKYWLCFLILPLFLLALLLFATKPAETWEIIFYPPLLLVMEIGIGLAMRKGFIGRVKVFERTGIREEQTMEGVKLHGDVSGVGVLNLLNFNYKKWGRPLTPFVALSNAVSEKLYFLFKYADVNDPLFFQKNFLIFLTLDIMGTVLLLALCLFKIFG